jgi:phosphoglycolate phosphatase
MLLLWDIDFTLLDIAEFKHDLYGRVLTSLTGRQFNGLASAPGLNTPEKVRLTLIAHGIFPAPQLVSDFVSALALGYCNSQSQLIQQGRLLPGALSALIRYSTVPHVTQAIVTGATAAIARGKLEAFDILRFFNFRCSSFGDETADRAHLIRAARDEYCRIMDEPMPFERVLLVADTTNDMSAASSVGAYAIGVATGKYSDGDLLSAGADTVLRDLTKLEPLDALILGNQSGMESLRGSRTELPDEFADRRYGSR